MVEMYRRLRFGNLVLLFLLQDRLSARTDSNPKPGDPIEVFSDEIDLIYGRVKKIIDNTSVSKWESGPNSVADQLASFREELEQFWRRGNISLEKKN